ncbi:UNVERIFIED_CONTAM: Purine permease 21 [Sesamum angustifolium]|uniref:Purine permease 21 n=1 Tax=Sesamum angustifolium TaxID=2727405 RepID=A0AAW2PBD4_9LAMI
MEKSRDSLPSCLSDDNTSGDFRWSSTPSSSWPGSLSAQSWADYISTTVEIVNGWAHWFRLYVIHDRLQYLPVTTYNLIGASQLGFNAVFSYFLNRQKFTPYIVNSVVLLTISSVLLVFQTDPGDSNKTTKNKYVIGFLCTLAASAGCALMLSLTQLAFHKVIKKETLRAVIDMTIYQSVVASVIIVIGLFASGEWRTLNREMEEYKLGKVSYVMNLLWTAISWEVFSVGCVGLIFKVSSLFSNVISILGLPVAPILAVILLHRRADRIEDRCHVAGHVGFRVVYVPTLS